jgi:hypothetical protein
LRNSEWIGFDLHLSDWHRSVLSEGKVKQLRLMRCVLPPDGGPEGR